MWAKIIDDGIMVFPDGEQPDDAAIPVVERRHHCNAGQRISGPVYRLSRRKDKVFADFDTEDVPAGQYDDLRDRLASGDDPGVVLAELLDRL